MARPISDREPGFGCLEFDNTTLTSQRCIESVGVDPDWIPSLAAGRQHFQDAGGCDSILIKDYDADNFLEGDCLTKAIPPRSSPDVDVGEVIKINRFLGTLGDRFCLPLPTPIALSCTDTICQSR